MESALLLGEHSSRKFSEWRWSLNFTINPSLKILEKCCSVTWSFCHCCCKWGLFLTLNDFRFCWRILKLCDIFHILLTFGCLDESSVRRRRHIRRRKAAGRTKPGWTTSIGDGYSYRRRKCCDRAGGAHIGELYSEWRTRTDRYWRIGKFLPFPYSHC